MSKTYQVQQIVNEQPCFSKPLKDILADLKIGGAIKILSPLEYITDRQRRYYKGVVLPALVKNDENGETLGWWDTEVKKQCNGLALLKKEIFYLDDGTAVGRLTTKGVGKKNMTAFIEEILSKVTPPDPNLRTVF